MVYSEENLVVLAKREGNKKRKYLVVNRLQGKHIPVCPSAALEMFEALAQVLLRAYPKERLLLIGFAETATAIGAAVAARLDAYYMQTTRECLPGVEYFYFSEVHSHATEQKLVREDVDLVIGQVDRIVFIEDEITTGNTILHIVRLLREAYGEGLCFSAASLLNGMEKENLKGYQEQEISLHWLGKISHENYEARVEQYVEDGSYHDCDRRMLTDGVEEIRPTGYLDARRLVLGEVYENACLGMCDEIQTRLSSWQERRVLVLGTEEFMYPALCVAKRLEEMGNQVWYHATTRSPISVCRGEGYPFRERYELASFYDRERRTFLYDIGEYEEVLIVTDAAEGTEGLSTLVHALCLCNNCRIYLVRWC